jgi:hypothetical protein
MAPSFSKYRGKIIKLKIEDKITIRVVARDINTIVPVQNLLDPSERESKNA